MVKKKKKIYNNKYTGMNTVTNRAREIANKGKDIAVEGQKTTATVLKEKTQHYQVGEKFQQIGKLLRENVNTLTTLSDDFDWQQYSVDDDPNIYHENDISSSECNDDNNSNNNNSNNILNINDDKSTTKVIEDLKNSFNRNPASASVSGPEQDTTKSNSTTIKNKSLPLEDNTTKAQKTDGFDDDFFDDLN